MGALACESSLKLANAGADAEGEGAAADDDDAALDALAKELVCSALEIWMGRMRLRPLASTGMRKKNLL